MSGAPCLTPRAGPGASKDRQFYSSGDSPRSRAQVSGDFGPLTPSGSAPVVDLPLFGGAPVSVSPPPNTVLFSLLGLTITADVQTVGADSISVDALDIVFNNFALAGIA